MRLKQNLGFNNDNGKKLYKKYLQNYLQKNLIKKTNHPASS